MSTIYFCEVMYLFVSMFDSATALLFLLIYLHLDTVSLYAKRRMNISTGKKCSDQRSFGRLLKAWILLPKGSLVLVTLIQCHVDRLVPPVHWGQCGNWFTHRIALCLSPHSILSSSFPLLPVGYYAAWTLFSQWKGRFCLFFWDGFSQWLSVYFFFLKP